MPIEIIWLEVHHPGLARPVCAGFGLLDAAAMRWEVRFLRHWEFIPNSEDRAVLEGMHDFLRCLEPLTALRLLSDSSNVVRCTDRLEVLGRTSFEELLEQLSVLLLNWNDEGKTQTARTSGCD